MAGWDGRPNYQTQRWTRTAPEMVDFIKARARHPSLAVFAQNAAKPGILISGYI